MSKKFLRSVLAKVRLWQFRLENKSKQKFECPICKYCGPFVDLHPLTGLRKHAKCPNCGALERHRIQFLVVQSILKKIDAPHMKMLHFAPEEFLTRTLFKKFGMYETADLNRPDVDHQCNLENLPFSNSTYDFVFASHVLEHVSNDKKAIQEIFRILKPNGIAVLPVPLVSHETIEYPEPNPNEEFHVRAPGLDYFDRYQTCFSRVETYTSDFFPKKFQLFVYEDRTQWPSTWCPLRQAMDGEKHMDIVPVCYV